MKASSKGSVVSAWCANAVIALPQSRADTPISLFEALAAGAEEADNLSKIEILLMELLHEYLERLCNNPACADTFHDLASGAPNPQQPQRH